MQSLQRDYINGALTPDEAIERVDRAAYAIERRKADMEELEKNASQLFGHEEYVREELSRVKHLGHFVSESSILALLRTFFRTRHPSVKLKNEGNGVFGIRLSDELRMDLQDTARRLGITWVDRSRGGILRFTTSGETAFEDSALDLVNSQHPLTRAAVIFLEKQMEPAIARLGAGVIEIDAQDAELLPQGSYFVVLAPQQVHGIRNRRLIETFAVNSENSQLLQSEISERLLYLLVEFGKDWTDEHIPPLENQAGSPYETSFFSVRL